MSDERNDGERTSDAARGGRGWGLALGTAAAMAAIALWVATRPVAAPPPEGAPSGGDAPTTAAREADAAARGESDRAPDDAREPAPPGPAPLVRSGETLALDAARVAERATFAVRVALPTPPPGAPPARARLLGDGIEPQWREVRVAPGADAGADGEATIELFAPELVPGRYVIEVETRERSHMPLRRYAIEVR